MLSRLQKYAGFTLIEIVMVAVLMTVLASMALARYTRTTTRFRAAEAQQTLLSLWGAQKKYRLNAGSYASSISNLDIELLTSNLFNYTVSTSTSALATAASSTGTSYTLTINENGIISCTPSGSTCTMLGY